MSTRLSQRLFVLLQHVLPQHGLSSLMFRLARCQTRWVAQTLIRSFNFVYRLDLAEAAEPNPGAYRDFNTFFTRALKPDARPLQGTEDSVVSPADGRISQIGHIDGTAILQAKGQTFELTTLLGGDTDRARPFVGGRFATIYLSPRDYHRLHMPIAGQLIEMVYVPGDLFSVNEATTSLVPGLFARNERVVAVFETAAGPMALVLVGAIFVGSIETVWHGMVTPAPGPRTLRHWDYRQMKQGFERGAEFGRFNMGSTVIALFGSGSVEWDPSAQPGVSMRLGQHIGRRLR